MSDPLLEPKFTITEAERLLGCKRSKVKELIRDRKLGFFREGTGRTARIYIPESQIKKHLQKEMEYFPSAEEAMETQRLPRLPRGREEQTPRSGVA